MTIRFLSTAIAVIALSFSVATAHAADADSGAKVFKKKCKACHTFEKGGKNRVGPNLYGIVGRKAGTKKGFKRYSGALTGSGIVWDEKNLDAFIKKPKGFLKKTRMAFAGIKKDKDRADLIAFLKAQAD